MSDFLLVATTFSNRDEAHVAAATLIQEKLVACAQILPEMESIYWWKNEIVNSKEWLLIFKTEESLYPELEIRLKQIHSYDTPEIIGISVSQVEHNYHRWLLDELRKDRQ